MGGDWDWRVTCYYGPDAKWPKVPGDLAIQTVHRGEHSRDMEVAVGTERADIGRITIERWGGCRWTRWDEVGGS